MFKFENILIPTNFSKHIEYVTDFAVELTKKTGSTIHLLHVVEENYLPADIVFAPHAKIVDIEQQIKKVAEENLKGIQERLKKTNYNVSTSLLKGNPVTNIIKYADENNIDIICMSAKEEKGLERFIFGSTTEKVLLSASCPVIIIKAPNNLKN
jgi:nucleotide-binding universal stress UspA family protein